MFKINLSTYLLAAGLFAQPVYADETMDSALQQTQDCLRQQNCASANTDAGKAAEQKALEAVGGNADDMQKLYDISADIMPILLQQADGDPAKMQAILQKAQTDPEGFLNSLAPELRTKIKNAAATVEKNRKSGQKP